jgi:hypothetical protein
VAAAIGVALAIVALEVSPASSRGDRPVGQPSKASSGATDAFTWVTATTLSSSSAPALGTDERWHVVYELQLANVRPQSTVESIAFSTPTTRAGLWGRFRGRSADPAPDARL